LTFLATQLDAALAAGQRAIVFVHYRLDGGPGGPAGKGVGPPLPPANAAWVTDCTLQNAAAVRTIIEKHPGLVLATFSGHDHAPYPPWSRETVDSPVYFTHAALVEGSFPASNAYSVVKLFPNCTLNVHGFENATSAVFPGPPNCTLSL
jgi:hypothetical protein